MPSSIRTPQTTAGDSISPVEWSVPSGTWRSISIPFALIVVAALCVPTIDSPIARLRPFTLMPDAIEAFLGRIETFGHSVGVAIIVVGVWMLDPARRRCLPRLVATTWGAGLAANLLKMSVARVRPFAWVDQEGNTLPQQFAGWFPLGMNDSYEQSFPSAHTATVVGLALGLSALYPRGRLLFGTIATLVAAQRVIYGAHYPSDVLAAAALAWIVVLGLFHIRAVNGWFTRFEQPLPTVWQEPQRRAA
jgi:membrane-associated phospholipid phosphatase